MLVSLEGITKVFSDGTVALRGVDLEIRGGEVLGLLGENGAGKTTLMKILAGVYKPTSGAIRIDGKPAKFKSAREAMRAGVAMVHQNLSLVPGLTALENIMLMHGVGGVSRSSARRRAESIAAGLGFEIDWDKDVEELPLGVRQRIEIVKALYWEAKAVVLDEPTAILSPPEVKSLFGVVGRLKEAGKAVVFITHKIPEVSAVADRAAVLRRGLKVGEFQRPFDEGALVRAMVGDFKPPRLERLGEPGDLVLEVEDLWVYDGGRPAVAGASLRLRRREILAVAGVEGNGQEELVDAIVGLRRPARGSVRVRGSVAYIPDDRLAKGLLPEAPLLLNALLGLERRFSRRGFMDRRSAREFAEKIMAEYSVVARGADAPVLSLSGGNQQKFMIGRELSKGADVVLAHQPTRGLDVATTEMVHKALVDARNGGAGILLVTSDLDEALKLADVVAVMYRGRITALAPAAEASVEFIGAKMAGL